MEIALKKHTSEARLVCDVPGDFRGHISWCKAVCRHPLPFQTSRQGQGVHHVSQLGLLVSSHCIIILLFNHIGTRAIHKSQNELMNYTEFWTLYRNKCLLLAVKKSANTVNNALIYEFCLS